MAAGAETVKGKAWGPQLGPAEHTGASLGVKNCNQCSWCPGHNHIEIHSVSFWGWRKRKSMVKAIALTDSTLLRFPSFLQPRKLKDEGKVAPQSKSKRRTAIPKSPAGILEGIQTNSHSPPHRTIAPLEVLLGSLSSALCYPFLLPCEDIPHCPIPQLGACFYLFASRCLIFLPMDSHLSSYPCCQEAGPVRYQGH